MPSSSKPEKGKPNNFGQAPQVFGNSLNKKPGAAIVRSRIKSASKYVKGKSHIDCRRGDFVNTTVCIKLSAVN